MRFSNRAIIVNNARTKLNNNFTAVIICLSAFMTLKLHVLQTRAENMDRIELKSRTF